MPAKPNRPLSGILVVALEQAVAAPLTSLKLAAAGARVLKIERDTGDLARAYDEVAHGESSYFVWLNAGKESVVIDLKSPADAAILQNMLARADVFIQNLAPGAAERAGFGSDALRRKYPRLITCDITGYGDAGPYAGMKAFDNLIQAEAGLIAVTGTPEAPSKVGISVCDVATGMHAYQAILEAVLLRARTGAGCGIKVSMFDCLANWMTVPYLHEVYGGRAPKRSGAHHSSVVPYGPYAANNGHQVMIAVGSERDWVRFCNGVLQRPELATQEEFRSNSRRLANRVALDRIIVPALGALTEQQLVARLKEAGVGYGRMNSVAELASHPQLRLMTVDTPTGPVNLPADPVRLADGESPSPGRIPGIGDQSDAIKREFAGSAA